ncbi:hypothetical protein K4S27_11260 [Staphylococcus epidermidis]|nr:hypothetical protein [Staphylococcus epidermidis]MCG2360210.1 hypothetical protein [Staphylococcus epidermidis]MCG2367208.1 hypothetical protein [Staphylococcus epidermidis]
MDFKIVYLTNGSPFIAYKNADGEFNYPNDEWTDIEPPNDVYFTQEKPLRFDFENKKWIGITKEEFLEDLAKNQEPLTPDEQEIKLAKLQLQLTLSNSNANKLSKELVDYKKRTEMLEQKLATISLKVTQLDNKQQGSL